MSADRRQVHLQLTPQQLEIVEQLRGHGIYGRTRSEIVDRLLCERMQQLAGAVVMPREEGIPHGGELAASS